MLSLSQKCNWRLKPQVPSNCPAGFTERYQCEELGLTLHFTSTTTPNTKRVTDLPLCNQSLGKRSGEMDIVVVLLGEGISVLQPPFLERRILHLTIVPSWLSTEGGWSWELHLAITDTTWWAKRHLLQSIAARCHHQGWGGQLEKMANSCKVSPVLRENALERVPPWRSPLKSPHALTYEIWKLWCLPHRTIMKAKWSNVCEIPSTKETHDYCSLPRHALATWCLKPG